MFLSPSLPRTLTHTLDDFFFFGAEVGLTFWILCSRYTGTNFSLLIDYLGDLSVDRPTKDSEI